MVKVWLSQAEFKLVKVSDPPENQPPPYGSLRSSARAAGSPMGSVAAAARAGRWRPRGSRFRHPFPLLSKAMNALRQQRWVGHRPGRRRPQEVPDSNPRQHLCLLLPAAPHPLPLVMGAMANLSHSLLPPPFRCSVGCQLDFGPMCDMRLCGLEASRAPCGHAGGALGGTREARNSAQMSSMRPVDHPA